jgi:ribosomal protein L3 glutamine methyltransferase
MTLGTWMRAAEDRLIQAGVFLGHGTDNYWDEALHLALPTLGIAFDADSAVLEQPLSPGQCTELDALLRRRIDGRVPVPYLTGIAWFAGIPFEVNRQVLIPRSPIAELIEEGFQPWFFRNGHSDLPNTILDLCCGNGCIGIACAEYMPDCRVDLADLSAEALAVARRNIAKYGLETRVSCYQGDLFDALPPGQTWDVIVCNPPYVDVQDMASLPPEYLHEPRLALEAGQDGLDLVKRILAEAADYLNDDGLLVVEVGNSWVALEEQFPDLPLTWPEFIRGGDGVFLLYKEQLEQYRASIAL